MERSINIRVPINALGLCGMTENVAVYDERNFRFFALTEAERNALSNLFFQFNDEFGILIDDFEEDILMVKQLPKAIKITETFIKRAGGSFVGESAERVHKALLFAQGINMPAEFCF